MKRFEIGEILRTRSICNHDTIYEAEVIKRTKKTITIVEDGKTKNRRIFINGEGNEAIRPHGSYSMAATFYAGDKMNTPAPQPKEQIETIKEEETKPVVSNEHKLIRRLEKIAGFAPKHIMDVAGNEKEYLHKLRKAIELDSVDQSLDQIIDDLIALKQATKVTRDYHTSVTHEKNSRVKCDIYIINQKGTDYDSVEIELIIDGEVKAIHEYDNHNVAISEAISLVKLNSI